jgi:hypothetical protein
MSVDYVKWQETKSDKWQEFDLNDINHLPQSHACNLFNVQTFKVVAKEGNQFIVSTPELVAIYRKKGLNVIRFADVLERSKRLNDQFQYAGFQCD